MNAPAHPSTDTASPLEDLTVSEALAEFGFTSDVVLGRIEIRRNGRHVLTVDSGREATAFVLGYAEGKADGILGVRS